MTEEQFEQFLREAARDHNPVPETPREEIWSQIRQGRKAERGAKVVFVKSPRVRRGMGIAAALALGIGIGMQLDRVGGGEPVAASNVIAESSAVGDVYRVVAADYLSDAETFLTMFRTDARAGRFTFGKGNPARQLLTTTRLLQASPAAQDPRMSDLLSDLELILMQIAQLRTSRNGEELELVTQGMEERSVLWKLHAVMPADPRLMNLQGVL